MIRLIKIIAYCFFAFLLPLWLFLYTHSNLKSEENDKPKKDTSVVYIINPLSSHGRDTFIINNSVNNTMSFPDSININVRMSNQIPGDFKSDLKRITDGLAALTKQNTEASDTLEIIMAELNEIKSLTKLDTALVGQARRDIQNLLERNKKSSWAEKALPYLGWALALMQLWTIK